MPVTFLMFTADGADGVCRTVINLANRLCRDHPVRIISVYRRRARSFYPIDPRITVSYLVEDRGHGPGGRVRRWLAARPTRLADPEVATRLTLLTDLTVARALRRLPAGVLISTRPSLHLVAARLGPARLLKIGQDHLNFRSRSAEPGVLDLIRDASVAGMDVLVTLTAADEDDYRQLLGDSGAVVRTIPNALSWPAGSPSPLTSGTVVSAGRLVHRKGMDRLIEAYAPIARAHPDWRLQIHGKGPLQAELQQLIDERGLAEQVQLMGQSPDLAPVLGDAAVFAMGSRGEGFPMVLLEAMSRGVPMVAFDCPRGPSEIVRDGRNGRLVDDGDLPGFTRALEALVTDASARARMGAQALVDADEYSIDAIAAQWEALFDAAVRRRALQGAGRRRGRGPVDPQASP